jgi:mono/diheme cytochrome c family protein
MKQIVDLEGSRDFQSLDVALVSIAVDPVADLSLAVRQYGISTPLLSDEGRNVSESYGVLRWAMPSGEPGHTFVLVDKNGKVTWIRDYGAPENGGLMYVSVDELHREVAARLPERASRTSLQIEEGAQRYQTYCLSCHEGATGGTMMDIPPPHNANGHTWHHPDCQLADNILHGSGEMGEMMRGMMDVPENTPRMPAWKGTLTEEEVAVILAYIKTWWTEEQRELQASATQRNC